MAVGASKKKQQTLLKKIETQVTKAVANIPDWLWLVGVAFIGFKLFKTVSKRV